MKFYKNKNCSLGFSGHYNHLNCNGLTLDQKAGLLENDLLVAQFLFLAEFNTMVKPGQKYPFKIFSVIINS